MRPAPKDNIVRSGLGVMIGDMQLGSWFTILRLYSPLEPFFTKEWRLSEIELVR